jgi:hypothetical protein
MSPGPQATARCRVPRLSATAFWKELSSCSVLSKVTEKVLRPFGAMGAPSAVISDESRPPDR